MAVNRVQRDRVVNAHCAYLECRIDSFTLDDQLMESDSKDDHTANMISSAMFRMYCDMTRHHNSGCYKLTPEITSMIENWVKLLQSEKELLKQDLPYLIDEFKQLDLNRDVLRWP